MRGLRCRKKKTPPCKYLNATLRMCRVMERAKNPTKKKLHFFVVRTRNVPCHAKFDTGVVSRMFVPYSEMVKARKAALDREAYNDWVWAKVVDRSQKVSGRLRGYKFHHEISTDRVAVSIIFSRRATGKPARQESRTARPPPRLLLSE